LTLRNTSPSTGLGPSMSTGASRLSVVDQVAWASSTNSIDDKGIVKFRTNSAGSCVVLSVPFLADTSSAYKFFISFANIAALSIG